MGITKRPARRARDTGASGAIKKAQFDANRKKEVGVSDLTLLSEVSNESITNNLKIRFQNGLIYTYIGHVLISVNPFRDLGIYTEQILESYKGKNRLEMPPHVFAVAENMFYQLKSYNENQCVIISGESGAGKTEAAKRIMQYVASASGESTSSIQQIKDMVLATNPLLESFGCAKTLRNDNSSRHGKYLQILFNKSSEPVGAHITNYLLEKNRVVGQLKGERNFHIFYQYCKGAPQRYREMYGIQTPETYLYTSLSQCTSVDGVDDVKDFEQTIRVMGTIGLSQQEQDDIFKMLAAILWIGNISFNEDENSATYVADTSVTAFAAYLLDVEAPALETALTTKIIESGGFGGRRGSVYESPLNRVQASAVRDALAKDIYQNLFEWIVARVNASLKVQGEHNKTLGILDIYGFEIFDHNSFEQICINYVNEKLQQIFIQLTLKTEQDEYVAEQIQWTPIKYFNNKIVCDLIEELRPPGIFSALNDACATAHADNEAADQSFAMKLNSLTSNPHLQLRSNKFVIKHYAGDVTYDVETMTDKNKDQLGKSLTRLITTSQGQFFTSLFPEAFESQESGAGKRRRRATASDKIKASANALMTTLSAAQPSYIRTIKPNQNRSPTEFSDAAVLHQVKYLGLQENIRIRRAGFAYRQQFDKFAEHFCVLSSKTSYAGEYTWQGDTRDAVLEIMNAAGIPPSEYQMGTTKVFIKTPETLFALEHMRDMWWHRMASRIQRAWRRHFKVRMDATLVIQKACKEYLGVAAQDKFDPPQDSFYQGRKERRRFSMLGWRSAYGDYLNCNDRQSAGGYLVSQVGIKGPIKFSARGEQLFSKLGRSSQRLSRTFIANETTFYTVRGDVVDSRLIYQIERTIAFSSIVQVGVSPYRDDWFAIVTKSKETSDLLLWCPLKTELISALGAKVVVENPIVYCKKPNKKAAVKFVRESTSNNKFDVYKSGTVHVGPGLPGNTQREEVPKPKKRTGTAVAQPRSQVRKPVATQNSSTPHAPPSRQTPASTNNYQAMPDPSSYQQQSTSAYHAPQVQQQQQNSYVKMPEPSYRASHTPSAPPPPPPPAQPAKPTATAVYDFASTDDGYMSLSAGQVVVVEQEADNGWTLAVTQDGSQTGWVPTAYISKN